MTKHLWLSKIVHLELAQSA